VGSIPTIGSAAASLVRVAVHAVSVSFSFVTVSTPAALENLLRKKRRAFSGLRALVSDTALISRFNRASALSVAVGTAAVTSALDRLFSAAMDAEVAKPFCISVTALAATPLEVIQSAGMVGRVTALVTAVTVDTAPPEVVIAPDDTTAVAAMSLKPVMFVLSDGQAESGTCWIAGSRDDIHGLRNSARAGEVKADIVAIGVSLGQRELIPPRSSILGSSSGSRSKCAVNAPPHRPCNTGFNPSGG